jgi:hypothetical protein
MTFGEYMSEVLKYERMTLGEAENRFLRMIMGESKSAYAIYSILKEQGRGIAYKNVYTKIKRLEELKLVEKVPGSFARRAINYRLTTQGLFYLLSLFVSYRFGVYWADLWKYYADNIILKTLVLPYFEIGTLKNARFNLSSSVLSYLRNCYLTTLDGCNYIKQFLPRHKGSGAGIIITHYDDLVDIDKSDDDIGPDYTVKSATNSLKKELEWEAKEMAFSLITKHASDFGVFLALLKRSSEEIERVGKAGVEPKELGRDKRFTKLLREVKKDFDRGFEVANAAAELGTQ